MLGSFLLFFIASSFFFSYLRRTKLSTLLSAYQEENSSHLQTFFDEVQTPNKFKRNKETRSTKSWVQEPVPIPVPDSLPNMARAPKEEASADGCQGSVPQVIARRRKDRQDEHADHLRLRMTIEGEIFLLKQGMFDLKSPYFFHHDFWRRPTTTVCVIVFRPAVIYRLKRKRERILAEDSAFRYEPEGHEERGRSRARAHSTDRRAPSRAASRAPSVGSWAPSRAGSRAPSVVSRAPSRAGSRALSSYEGSRAPSRAGSRAPMGLIFPLDMGA